MITEFHHSLNGAGRRIAASPDGSTIYVGGEFTAVDGKARRHLAAFDVASGDLVARFHPNVGGRVRAIAVSNSTVYVGGVFTRAGGRARSDLAAFRVQQDVCLRGSV